MGRLLKKLSQRRSAAAALKGLKGNQSKKTLVDEVDTSSESSPSLLSTQHGTSVESLSQNGKFDEVFRLVSKSNLDDWLPDVELIDNLEASKHSATHNGLWPRNTPTPLHIIVKHNPPPAVVQKMVQLLRDRFQIELPEDHPDHMGRTPLHVAVVNGYSTSEIIQVLVSGESLIMPAVHRDSSRRTALHWACQPVQMKSRRKTQMAQWHQKLSIEILLEAFPEAASLRDEDGKTPVDYGRAAKLPGSVIQSLVNKHDQFAPAEDKLGSAVKDDGNTHSSVHVKSCDDVSTIGSRDPMMFIAEE